MADIQKGDNAETEPRERKRFHSKNLTFVVGYR